MLTESAEIMVVELLRFMAQVLNLHGLIIICMAPNVELEGQVWCSGESCLTESPVRGFEAWRRW